MLLTLAETNIATMRMIDDHAEFTRLPAAAQSDILIRLGWVHRIVNVGRGHKGSAVKAAAADLGIHPSAINRYLARFMRKGWRGLKDARVAGNGGAKGLPEDFKEWVKGLHLQNQRSTTGREVHRQVIERWSKWKRTGDPALAIPGYLTPPPAGSQGYPVGWSEDQIVRLRPDAYALTMARQGGKAGAKFLPSILKTRVGVRFGQVVFFDDQDYDSKIAAPGLSQRTLRPQGFNALEYLSASFLEYCIRLRWWDADKKQHRTLTGIDYTWFQILYFQRHGYRTDDVGTTIVEEHGTASGYANKELWTPDGHHSLAKAWEALSGGKIQTVASGLFNQPAFAGMLFRPQSSGNPNFKAPLEGIFNLVRNRFAALPGPTGLSREMSPAEQYGQDLYVKQLLKVWDRLDDQHRAYLQFPVMTYAQFGAAAAAVYAAINSRTDHELEGWHKCNHIVPQFRWTADDSSRWLSQGEMLALSPKQRSAAEALMEEPGHVRPFNLSPAHVAQAHKHELTPIPDHWIPLLIPVQWSREAIVASNRTVTIQDKTLGPEPFRYIARFRQSDGALTLKPGTKLRIYLNPFDTTRLYVCRADGSWLGVLHEMTRAAFTDTEAIIGQLHERAEMKADMDLEVRPHLEGLIHHREGIKRVNDRLDKGKPVTPDEIAAARSDAGHKAQRTAAENRLQGRAEEIIWDDMPDPRPAPGPVDAFAGLRSESDADL